MRRQASTDGFGGGEELAYFGIGLLPFFPGIH